jgi:hypothetical protein
LPFHGCAPRTGFPEAVDEPAAPALRDRAGLLDVSERLLQPRRRTT